MEKLLLFAGTTEGRKLSEYLSERKISHTLCVATRYGEDVLKDSPFVTVRRGRMEREEIRALIEKENYLAVVDATHPYAEAVTGNIRAAVEEANKMTGVSVPYFRLKREALLERGWASEELRRGEVVCFETNRACEEALRGTVGNILLTTGSKELSCYCVSEKVKSRLYVRVLPSLESLSACAEHGICGKQIIAMQGPFTADMNEAIIRQFGISVLVTKESGASGGFPEKMEAAKKAGIRVFVIGRPKEEGDCFSEVCRKIEELMEEKGFCEEKAVGESRRKEPPEREKSMSEGGCLLRITLAGVGMGSREGLTGEVQEAIDGADILMGAARMLASYQSGERVPVSYQTEPGGDSSFPPPPVEKRGGCAGSRGEFGKRICLPLYQPERIVACLKEIQNQEEQKEKKVVILFSGDSGFFSGCQRLREALEKEMREGGLRGTLHTLPGISSVAALSSRTGESYQDAAIYSMHGRKVPGLARKIRENAKTFLLMSGVEDVNRLGELLEKEGLEECEITVGYQLSYAGEQVRRLSPQECRAWRAEGLYVCLVKNPRAERRRLTHGMADRDFIRDRVPMTKEEVREISICKLHLQAGAVVYDIGSGTGSIAVEIANLSEDIQVYAVEQKREACSLMERNREKFGLENITVVEAQALEGLSGLPAATHAFIGGSGGHLREILAELCRRSPGIRVVTNAVSVETICEIRECIRHFDIKDAELVQVQVSRAKAMGNYHLMQAENPVWICAFYLRGESL